MQILIVTAGSRGDVAPFTGLGQRLQRAGHQVAIAAHEPFAALVRGCDLEYRSLPGDPQELVRVRTEARSEGAARSAMVSFLEGLGEGVFSAAEGGTDLLLTAFGPAPLSCVAAEALGIPSMGVYLAPAVPTGDFPLPGWPHTDGLDRAGNLEAGRALLERAGALYAGVLPRLRAQFGLPDAPTEASHQGPGADGWPVCHGFSPLVVPRPADWPPEVEVTGYWWPARPQEWQPPSEVVDFLQAGPPPVFIGFGSMAPHQGERLSEVVAAAVARAGVRAVVQAGWAGLTSAGSDILAIGDVPHDWLFPRTAAVVHHAGAGTAAAGLRAGVPAVAVPVLADQPFWASRLHRLGVAPHPIPFGDLTAEALGDALKTCVSESTYLHRATELAHHIAAEDGATAVLGLINRWAG